MFRFPAASGSTARSSARIGQGPEDGWGGWSTLGLRRAPPGSGSRSGTGWWRWHARTGPVCASIPREGRRTERRRGARPERGWGCGFGIGGGALGLWQRSESIAGGGRLLEPAGPGLPGRRSGWAGIGARKSRNGEPFGGGNPGSALDHTVSFGDSPGRRKTAPGGADR